jgi:hypothetical protein
VASRVPAEGARWGPAVGAHGTLRSCRRGVLILISVPGSRPRGDEGSRLLGRSREHSDRGGVHVRGGVRRTEAGYAASGRIPILATPIQY